MAIYAESINADTVLERMIASENPYKGIKARVAFFNVGIDNIKQVSVSKLDISVRNDVLVFDLAERLACRTSSEAFIKDDVKAKFEFTAEINLTDCSITNQSVSMLEIDGTFASIATTLKEKIESSLQIEVGMLISKNC